MPKVRIVGISSSPRHANTELLVKEALVAAEVKYGAVTEFISFKGKKIYGCLDCKSCTRRRERRLVEQCVLKDDWQELVTPLVEPVPNGLIIGAPVYFANVNAQLRAFMERCTSLFKPYWYPEIPHTPPDWSRTAAGAVSVGFHRHGGQEVTVNTILQWLLICGFVVVGSHDLEKGPIGYFGGEAWQHSTGESSKDSVLRDEWGLLSAQVVGERVAETAILLARGAEAAGKWLPGGQSREFTRAEGLAITVTFVGIDLVGGGQKQVEVDACQSMTISEVLDRLEQQLEIERLQDQLHTRCTVLVNGIGIDHLQGWETPVLPGGRVSIIPMLGGG